MHASDFSPCFPGPRVVHRFDAPPVLQRRRVPVPARCPQREGSPAVLLGPSCPRRGASRHSPGYDVGVSSRSHLRLRRHHPIHARARARTHTAPHPLSRCRCCCCCTPAPAVSSRFAAAAVITRPAAPRRDLPTGKERRLISRIPASFTVSSCWPLKRRLRVRRRWRASLLAPGSVPRGRRSMRRSSMATATPARCSFSRRQHRTGRPPARTLCLVLGRYACPRRASCLLACLLPSIPVTVQPRCLLLAACCLPAPVRRRARGGRGARARPSGRLRCRRRLPWRRRPG